MAVEIELVSIVDALAEAEGNRPKTVSMIARMSSRLFEAGRARLAPDGISVGQFHLQQPFLASR